MAGFGADDNTVLVAGQGRRTTTREIRMPPLTFPHFPAGHANRSSTRPYQVIHRAGVLAVRQRDVIHPGSALAITKADQTVGLSGRPVFSNFTVQAASNLAAPIAWTGDHDRQGTDRQFGYAANHHRAISTGWSQ
jgi:hypothetical protein